MIGLTSAANADFVRSLGCYDEVVTYDRVTSLRPDSAVAFVDMAGNSELRATLHRHFGDQMKYSGRIGLTHRNSSPDEPELPGAKPAWFFAPDQIRKRAKEWGPGGIDGRFGAAWSGFAPMLDRWLKVVRRPRREVGETGLSRYAQWPRSAGSGTHSVGGRVSGRLSVSALSARSPNGIGSFAGHHRENAAKTAGARKRECWTERTIFRSPPKTGWRNSKAPSQSPTTSS